MAFEWPTIAELQDAGAGYHTCPRTGRIYMGTVNPHIGNPNMPSTVVTRTWDFADSTWVYRVLD